MSSFITGVYLKTGAFLFKAGVYFYQAGAYLFKAFLLNMTCTLSEWRVLVQAACVFVRGAARVFF